MSRHVPRIHFSIDGLVTMCGTLPQAITDERTSVTCRLCSKRLGEAEALVAAERDRRGDHRPAILEGHGQTVVGAEGARAIARSVAGEPVSTGPRWGSVRSAMAALAMTKDAQRSVASSSSPDRFGRGGHGGDAGPTPTTPRETREDTIDLERALARACVEMRIGDRLLTAEVVRALAEPRLLGRSVERRVQSHLGGKLVDRRSSVRDRVEVTAEELGALSGLTKHQVGIVVRRVTAAVAEELARKGLIPARAVAKERARESEDIMASAAGYDLEGWKDIAPLVERSEDTCKKLADRNVDPLPVTRYLGRVVAKRSEVLEWVTRQASESAA